jgi:hypothetical protein
MSELTVVLPPPLEPVRPATEESLDRAEERLGTRLPSDYREFLKTYGGGSFYEFFFAINFGDPDGYRNIEGMMDILNANLEVDRSYPDRALHNERAFPSENGLLAWGGSNNGDFAFWRTAGAPDEWTVVLVDDEWQHAYHYEMNATQFLASWVARSIIPPCFPEDLIEADEPVFYPGGG